jgi:hypothetical protein
MAVTLRCDYGLLLGYPAPTVSPSRCLILSVSSPFAAPSLRSGLQLRKDAAQCGVCIHGSIIAMLRPAPGTRMRYFPFLECNMASR